MEDELDETNIDCFIIKSKIECSLNSIEYWKKNFENINQIMK